MDRNQKQKFQQTNMNNETHRSRLQYVLDEVEKIQARFHRAGHTGNYPLLRLAKAVRILATMPGLIPPDEKPKVDDAKGYYVIEFRPAGTDTKWEVSMQPNAFDTYTEASQEIRNRTVDSLGGLRPDQYRVVNISQQEYEQRQREKEDRRVLKVISEPTPVVFSATGDPVLDITVIYRIQWRNRGVWEETSSDFYSLGMARTELHGRQADCPTVEYRLVKITNLVEIV